MFILALIRITSMTTKCREYNLKFKSEAVSLIVDNKCKITGVAKF